MSQPIDEDAVDRRRENIVSALLVTIAAVCWAVRFWAHSHIASLLGLGLIVVFVVRQGFLVTRKDPEESAGSYLTYGFLLAFSTFAPTVFCGVSRSSDAVPDSDIVRHVASAFLLATIGWAIHTIVACTNDRTMAVLFAIVQFGLAVVGWFVSIMAVPGVWL